MAERKKVTVEAIDGASCDIDGKRIQLRLDLSSGPVTLDIATGMASTLLALVADTLASATSAASGVDETVVWPAKALQFERLIDGSLGLKAELSRGPVLALQCPIENLALLQRDLREIEAEQTTVPPGAQKH